MNPLISLWLLVLAISVLLGGVFYLADHYASIIGNFYVLLSIFLTAYGFYFLNQWLRARRQKGQGGWGK